MFMIHFNYSLVGPLLSMSTVMLLEITQSGEELGAVAAVEGFPIVQA